MQVPVHPAKQVPNKFKILKKPLLREIFVRHDSSHVSDTYEHPYFVQLCATMYQ